MSYSGAFSLPPAHGDLDRRRWAAWGLSAFGTLVLHLWIFPVTLSGWGGQVLPEVPKPMLVPKPEAPPQEQPQLAYTLVEPSQEEDEVDPAVAVAMASRSRLARDTVARAEAPPGGPEMDAADSHVSVQIGRRASPSPARPALQAVPERQAAPTPPLSRERSNPERPDIARRPLPEPELTAPAGTLPTESSEASRPTPPAPPPPRPQAEPARPRPPVRDLRAHPASSGSAGPKGGPSSCQLADEKAVQTLRSKYGDYMDEVAKRLNRSWNAELSAGRRSYRVGEIRIRFAITGEGAIGGVRVTQAIPAMVVEKALCLRTIRNAAPFPPLPPAMREDPLVQDIPVIFLFRR